MEQITQPSQIYEASTQPTSEKNTFHQKRNIYPLVRHVFIIAVALATVSIVIFLIYQNGQSIYDKGL